ncbi:hypothetical protein [Actibacterium sp. MT2.3-13A]|uniref:hypothetical protein n=1 Tax=Actibacterium sp. MT2.3-13A TaxID=2828332 RepID=UPI001BA7E431|nr:hypothetical protein [Actibacterium sp. MT2.3-13A]
MRGLGPILFVFSVTPFVVWAEDESRFCTPEDIEAAKGQPFQEFAYQPGGVLEALSNVLGCTMPSHEPLVIRDQQDGFLGRVVAQFEANTTSLSGQDNTTSFWIFESFDAGGTFAIQESQTAVVVDANGIVGLKVPEGDLGIAKYNPVAPGEGLQLFGPELDELASRTDDLMVVVARGFGLWPSDTRSVKFVSEPDEADVWSGKEHMGRTETRTMTSPDRLEHYRMTHEGFKDCTFQDAEVRKLGSSATLEVFCRLEKVVSGDASK